MTIQAKRLREQWVLLGICLALLIYYWTIYRTLAHQAVELDRPLAASWKKLTDVTQGNAAIQGVDPASMTVSLRRMENSTALVQQTLRSAKERIAPDPETRSRLQEPFQLLEFDKSRLNMIANLRTRAEAKKVVLEAGALAGFPEYSSTLAQPALLWAQLDIVNQVANTAIVQEPRVLKALTLLPTRLYTSKDGRDLVLAEFPVRVELLGSPGSLAAFLQSLPLRSTELKEFAAREIPVKRQALFIDKFIAKNATNNLNEAQLDLIVSGFVSLD